jgi:uncharacterized protein YcgI (DUF1989 family)
MGSTEQVVKIDPRTAYATEMKNGTTFKIRQSGGAQLAVLIAFKARKITEYFSQANTMISLAFGPYKRQTSTVAMPYSISKGDVLVSDRWNKMLTLADDTFGQHDIIFGPCDSYLNTKILGMPEGYPGCRELHADALKTWGVSYEHIPPGVNLFQNVSYSKTGIMSLPTKTKPDDMVLFEAHDDLVVSVTACPCPLGELTPIIMEIAAPSASGS